jgi:hypothetical protein
MRIRGIKDSLPILTCVSRGERRTSPVRDPDPETDELIFLGGSFTQGWGVEDSETFAWRVQERFGDLRVRNFGVSGYGGVQSLLVLKGLLAESHPKFVIYGMIPDHERRNVASSSYLRHLTMRSGRQISMPYGVLGSESTLVLQSPIHYPRFLGSGISATIAVMEQAYTHHRARKRESQSGRVTEAVLLRLNKLSRDNGAHFAVALFAFERPSEEYWEAFARRHEMGFINCNVELGPELTIPRDSHPNAKAHEIFSERITLYLEPLMTY